jgi:glycerophosphoryl diester phosphodiesterase
MVSNRLGTLQKVAHRGGSHLAPENTLAAFRHALTLHIDTIELDVQMSCDGHAIIFHDHTVERLTDGQGNILDLDFAYLRSLNAAAHFPGGWSQPECIPTLREVLDLAKGHVKVQIELKYSQRDVIYGRYAYLAETVVAEVQAAHMLDQVLIISFDWDMLALIKSLEPALETGAIVAKQWWLAQTEDALDVLCERAERLGCAWLNIDANLFSPDMPDRIHRRGLQLGLWTVNRLEELHRLAHAGVDALTSDRPDLFRECHLMDIGPLLK